MPIRSVITVAAGAAGLLASAPAWAGAVILGLNLEFVDARFSDEGFDGGLGIHAGYEFSQWKSWNFGALLSLGILFGAGSHIH